MSSLFCSACGHPLKETSRFCTECGFVRQSPQMEAPTQVIEFSAPNLEAGNAAVAPGGGSGFSDRLKSKTGKFLVAGSTALVVLLVIGFSFLGGSESSGTTAPISDSSVASVAPTIPPVDRYLELGQLEAACSGNELWWNDSSQSFEVMGTSSDASVIDAWKYRGRENLIVQCGTDTQISVAIVLKLEPDRLRLIASESAVGTLVERTTGTVARVGVSRACCYPDVPLETASVFRFQFRGQIKVDTRAIVRFAAWDVANWRCKGMSDPVWGDGEDLDGFEFTDVESGFITVCSESSDIFDLQRILVDKGYNIDVDGQFGPGTLDALLDFASQDNNVGVEGVVLDDGDFRYARRRS